MYLKFLNHAGFLNKLYAIKPAADPRPPDFAAELSCLRARAVAAAAPKVANP